MKRINNWIIGAALFGSTAMALPAHAASVAYYLDQSNTLADGVNYAKVTLQDVGNDIQFTVELLEPPLIPNGDKYGIKGFGFNVDPLVTLTAANFALPVPPQIPTGSSWEVLFGNQSRDGFGKFDVAVNAKNKNPTLDPLIFSIINVVGDTLATYSSFFSGGNGGEGSVLFAAHVIDIDAGEESSMWIGGSTVVPLPASMWLFISAFAFLLGLHQFKRWQESSAVSRNGGAMLPAGANLVA